ncbi:hypothetical protein MKEN_01334400 [Mycena kentingensis (nom. inval.)]|nr:hypothetical protein MKEN_01334400 [Mycena kentingensis (nom. inval.)]
MTSLTSAIHNCAVLSLNVLVAFLALALGYIFYQVVIFVYAEATSTLHGLPGPKRGHWLYGNVLEALDLDRDIESEWIAEHGKTMKVHNIFNQKQLFTIDTKAIQHALTHTTIYQRSEASRYGLGRIVGPGILVVEGEQHRQQRKIMNPAFGAPQVRALTSIFVDKALQLRDIWAAEIAAGSGSARVEAISWLNKTTLDIIGLAGFNYDINALGTANDAEQDELATAFERVFASETNFSLWRIMQMKFKPLRKLVHNTLPFPLNHETHRTPPPYREQARDRGERDLRDGNGRDLLTLLVRANTSKEIPEDQRLCDEDVIAQVPTFLVAGHETTSTAVSWALYALSLAPHIQAKLRAELLGLETDSPTMEELNALPYLESVVRETLRLYAPVPSTGRMAMSDDVLPLETPYVDRNGVAHDSLRVNKGQALLIPILPLNRDKTIWGENALEFIPERWKDIENSGASKIPGAWAHMITFLGGPRSCIGFRFSLVETKAILFTLIRAFKFSLAVPPEDMTKHENAIVQRPSVRSEKDKGAQLPLIIRRVQAAAVSA